MPRTSEAKPSETVGLLWLDEPQDEPKMGHCVRGERCHEIEEARKEARAEAIEECAQAVFGVHVMHTEVDGGNVMHMGPKCCVAAIRALLPRSTSAKETGR
jgi:hypothetical protein